MDKTDSITGVQILNSSEVKLVEKPWGWEKWIADGSPNFRYALKEIFIRAPHKSSVQVHQAKEETNFVQKGRGILHYSPISFDLNKYLDGNMSDEKVSEIVNSLEKEDLLPGKVFHMKPGFIHSVEAIEDLLMIEASSTELDDVFRLRDDSGRGHGRIDGEHS